MIAADNVTRVTAIVALALSVASLVWQFASFLLSGPRIRVRIAEGLRDPATGGVMIAPLSTYADGGASQRSRGCEHVIGVEAENNGRLPATVTAWSISIGGNTAVYMNTTDPRNPPVMHRLEPHSNQWWWAPAEDIRWSAETIAKTQRRVPIRGRINVGSRRTRISRNSLRFVNGQAVSREPLLARALARIPRKWLR